jgi:hypothetical protein
VWLVRLAFLVVIVSLHSARYGSRAAIALTGSAAAVMLSACGSAGTGSPSPGVTPASIAVSVPRSGTPSPATATPSPVAATPAAQPASIRPLVPARPPAAKPAAVKPVQPRPAAQRPAAPKPPAPSVYYANCAAVKAAGAAPLHRTDAGYRPALDRDNDGVACDT